MAQIGAAHSNAKITEDDVRAMRAARADGKTVDQIHAEFSHLGLTHSSVEKIVYRLAWKHVE
jgi:hypothetical protein